jgi:hypothetical protein
MTWEQLVAVFAVINEPYAKAYVATPPTAESIERINRALNISLPGSLVRFAEDCPSYGTWFASIGADYDSYLHILELNKAFRAEGDFGNDGKLLPPCQRTWCSSITDMTATVTAWKWAHITNKLENSGFGIGTKSVGSFPTSCGLHFANTSNGMLEIGGNTPLMKFAATSRKFSVYRQKHGHPLYSSLRNAPANLPPQCANCFNDFVSVGSKCKGVTDTAPSKIAA